MSHAIIVDVSCCFPPLQVSETLFTCDPEFNRYRKAEPLLHPSYRYRCSFVLVTLLSRALSCSRRCSAALHIALYSQIYLISTMPSLVPFRASRAWSIISAYRPKSSLMQLPNDILVDRIFSFLEVQDILRLRQVRSHFLLREASNVSCRSASISIISVIMP